MEFRTAAVAAVAFACLTGCADKRKAIPTLPTKAPSTKQAPVTSGDQATDAFLQAQSDLVTMQKQMIDEARRTLKLEAARRAELQAEVAALRKRVAALQLALQQKDQELERLKKR